MTAIDPPHPPSMPLTLAAELNYIRSHGVQVAQDNGLPEVSFSYAPRGHYKTTFTVAAEGYMNADIEMTDEMKEVEKLH